MDGPRKFIAVDNHKAVKVGGLRRGMSHLWNVSDGGSSEGGRPAGRHKIVKGGEAKVYSIFPEVIREGADELTLQAHEVGVRRTCIDTAYVVDDGSLRWSMRVGMPLARRFTEELNNKELHPAAKSKKHGENQKAKALWAMQAAKDGEEEYYDPDHQIDSQERSPHPPGLVGSSPEKSNGRSGEGAGMSGTE